ncbi:MAG: hypothetical protein V4691_08195 [Pseudomonadota bacterium]
MLATSKEQMKTAGGSHAFADYTIALPETFQLESGEKLKENFLKLRFFGNRSGKHLFVCGGISGSRIVCDDGETPGFWRKVFHEHGAVDFQKYCIISVDFLPNDNETVQCITTDDQARAIFLALNMLEIFRLDGFIGASYGGMVGLKLASLQPGYCKNYCILSAAHRPNPIATAYRGIQRRVIEFSERVGQVEEGLSLARQIAMIGYRTPQEFSKRFSCRANEKSHAARFDVCDYLESRGKDFSKKFTAHRYLTLSHSLDDHFVDIETIADPLFLVSVEDDQIVYEGDIAELATCVHAPVRHENFVSPYGHDAFLCEPQRISGYLQQFLERFSV